MHLTKTAKPHSAHQANLVTHTNTLSFIKWPFHTVVGNESPVDANNLPLAFEEPELEQIKDFLKISHAAVIVALVQCPGGGVRTPRQVGWPC